MHALEFSIKLCHIFSVGNGLDALLSITIDALDKTILLRCSTLTVLGQETGSRPIRPPSPDVILFFVFFSDL